MKYTAPLIKIKGFGAVPILTASETTNVQSAEAAIKNSGIDKNNVVKITL